MPASRARKLSQLMSEGGSLSAVGISGVNVIGSAEEFPATNTATDGDMVLVTDINKLFVFNGSGWDSVSMVQNQSPAIITPIPDQTFATSDSAITVQLAATDPEGLLLNWVISESDSNQTICTIQLNQSNIASQYSTLTITPTSDTNVADGSFNVTAVAYDNSGNSTSDVFQVSLQNMNLVSGASFNLSTGGYYATDEKVEGTHSLYLNGNGHVQRNIVSPSTPYVYDDYTISMWFQKYNTNPLYLFNVNDKTDAGNSFGSACTIITSTNAIYHVVDKYNGSSYAQNSSINTNMVNSTLFDTGGANNQAWYHYVVSYSVSSNVIGQWITSQGGTFGDILSRTGSPNRQGIGLKTNLWYLHGSAGNASDNGRAKYDAIHILNTAADATVAENLYNGNAPASTQYRFLLNGNGDNA